MSRLRDDQRRLVLKTYRQVIEIRATYGDVDSFQVLNNVALARFFEEGRATMNMEVFGVDAVVRPSTGVQLMFVSVAIDYLAPGGYPGMVTIGTTVSQVGRSSFTQIAGLFQEGRCIALCDAVTVYAVDGRATALPSNVRNVLQAYAEAS